MKAATIHDLDPRETGNALVSARSFADLPRIHALFKALRAHGRPLWVTPDGYRPFWAVTRHAQVVQVSSDNESFISSRRLNLMSRLQEAAAFRGAERYGKVLRTLVHMDEPDHRKYRAVAQPWFNALAIRRTLPAARRVYDRTGAPCRAAMRAMRAHPVFSSWSIGSLWLFPSGKMGSTRPPLRTRSAVLVAAMSLPLRFTGIHPSWRQNQLPTGTS